MKKTSQDGGFSVAGENNQSPNSKIEISFSRAMQTDALEDLLRISPEIEGNFSWRENILIFTPEEPWPEGAVVQVRLEAGAKSALGLPIRQDLERPFNISRIRLAYLWPMGEI